MIHQLNVFTGIGNGYETANLYLDEIMSLNQIGDSIWTVVEPLSLGPLELNSRATVIRLEDGTVWVHSPVKLNDDNKAAVADLGDVQWLVAPNLLHNLFIGEWKTAFPQAHVIAPKGFEKKCPDLDISSQNLESQSWADEVSVVFLEGMPSFQEHLFYHHKSQTLIITDFCFFNPEVKGVTSLYFWLNKVKNKMNVPFLVRFSIKDKKSLLKSLSVTRDWPIQKISMCHHAIISNNAQEEWNTVLDSLGG